MAPNLVTPMGDVPHVVRQSAAMCVRHRFPFQTKAVSKPDCGAFCTKRSPFFGKLRGSHPCIGSLLSRVNQVLH